MAYTDLLISSLVFPAVNVSDILKLSPADYAKAIFPMYIIKAMIKL